MPGNVLVMGVMIRRTGPRLIVLGASGHIITDTQYILTDIIANYCK